MKIPPIVGGPLPNTTITNLKCGCILPLEAVKQAFLNRQPPPKCKCGKTGGVKSQERSEGSQP